MNDARDKAGRRAPPAVLAMLAAAAAALFAAGCGHFWEDPYVTVTETPLNWCEIHYYNASREPVRRTSVRISGDGIVEATSGTSKRVSDSFAKGKDDPNWNDMRVHRYSVEPSHVRETFQQLVNAGMFEREKTFASTDHPSPGRFLAFRAAIDGKTYSEVKNLFESDPDLAERMYNVVLEFNRPVLRRKAAAGR